MRAGRLRNRIDIQQRSTDKDAAGEQLDSWVSIGYRRANIQNLSGTEYITAKGTGSEITTKIHCRYDALTRQITPAFRIVDRDSNAIYDIQSALRFKTSDQYIECLCIKSG